MTPLWTATALQAATGGQMPRPFDATGISIDTRTLQPGDLFIALQANTDGHAHAAAALKGGAAGVLVSHAANLPPNAPVLLVNDTLGALTALGQAARARFTGRVVAVTGSVGKTTAKEMLRTALGAFGQTHAAHASYNNHWGVPLTLARTREDAAYAVLEIGMNNPGEIAPLAALAAPHVAIVTTIAPAHIGHLGSLEAIAEEKATLLDHLLPGGAAIIPQPVMLGLDPSIGAAPQAQAIETILRNHAKGPILTFGPNGDAQATNTTPDPTGTTIEAQIAGTPVKFRLNAPGPHMAANALAALAAVHALGLDPTVAAKALESFTPMPGRGAQRTLQNGQIRLLDESYNANPASVRAALQVLHLLPARRHIAVLGDMLELGAFAPREHASLAPAVTAAADLLYACGPLTRPLFNSVPRAVQAHHAPDAEALAPIVAAAIRPGDAVLVKGSLGSRMRLVVEALDAAPPTFGPPTCGQGQA